MDEHKWKRVREGQASVREERRREAERKSRLREGDRTGQDRMK